jgi:hypothetical protein
MNIAITKELMYKEIKNILHSLFNLPELEKVIIKEVQITSLYDEESLNIAINNSFHDIYSDIDIDIYINLNQEEYNSDTPIYSDYLTRLGFKNDILGMLHFCSEKRGEVIRICKTNGARFDLNIITSYKDGIPRLPHKQLNKTSSIHNAVKNLDEFWFTAIQALGKLMRKDYLIASHLSHMLIQESLVLQMIQRDIEKNTNFHRYGYGEQLDYLVSFNNTEFPFTKENNPTYNHIAKLLYSAAQSFDKLCYNLDKSCESRLKNYIDIWSYYFNN